MEEFLITFVLKNKNYCKLLINGTIFNLCFWDDFQSILQIPVFVCLFVVFRFMLGIVNTLQSSTYVK